MRSVAIKGYEAGDSMLSPEECWEVTDFIIQRSSSQKRPLDMRIQTAGFAARLQYEVGEAGCHWKDLVESFLRERPSVVEDIVPRGVRQQKREQFLGAARQVVGLPRQERLQEWQRLTDGSSEPAMYRWQRELGRMDAVDVGAWDD